MSNYHVLAVTPKLTKAQVIFHIPIPVENNTAGVSLRLALYQYQGNATIVSAIPDHATNFSAENANIQSGAIYEYQKTVVFTNANSTPVQKQTEMDNMYTSLDVSVLAKIRKVLKYWGKHRNVP